MLHTMSGSGPAGASVSALVPVVCNRDEWEQPGSYVSAR